MYGYFHTRISSIQFKGYFYFSDGPQLFIFVCFVVILTFSASEVVCRKIGKDREVKGWGNVLSVSGYSPYLHRVRVK
jgi:hypothetical protein